MRTNTKHNLTVTLLACIVCALAMLLLFMMKRQGTPMVLTQKPCDVCQTPIADDTLRLEGWYDDALYLCEACATEMAHICAEEERYPMNDSTTVLAHVQINDHQSAKLVQHTQHPWTLYSISLQGNGLRGCIACSYATLETAILRWTRLLDTIRTT